MNKFWIILSFVVLPVSLMAQQMTEYNRKGDIAMKRLDYRDASMWYEEGVANCDLYSISQLTTIWQTNEKMRSSMRSAMTKCLTCLNVMATEGDTVAISKLILYYTEGIGASKSEELASYWKGHLESLRNPPVETVPVIPAEERRNKPKEPMKFFLGYAYSIESPYGLTFGGVKNRLGWYARFRTNFSFKGNYEGECRGTGEIEGTLPGDPIFKFTNEKKTNSYAGTAGLVVKCTSWLYTSLGVGYGNRELLCQYVVVDPNDYRRETPYWAKSLDNSYQGIAADLDIMVKIGPVFLSAGCNTINFKYMDLNAGLGVFF